MHFIFITWLCIPQGVVCDVCMLLCFFGSITMTSEGVDRGAWAASCSGRLCLRGLRSVDLVGRGGDWWSVHDYNVAGNLSSYLNLFV